MNRTTTIVLAALCALLGAFILAYEKDLLSTEQAFERARRLHDIPARRVDWVSIKNPRDRILLRKIDGRWRITEPRDNPADAEGVEDLLWDVQRLEYARHFTVNNPAKDLENYGLAPPAVVFRARWNGEEVELRLGARTPMGNSVYAQTRKNEKHVYAVSAGLLDKLSRGAAEWRSRRLVDVDLERVEEIRLSGISLKTRLERRDGRWFLKSPLKARASAARVHALLTTLDRARVERFVTDHDERLEDFGLKEPPVSLRLDIRDGDDIEVHLGKTDPENPAVIFARRLDAASIVTVSTNLPAELALSVDQLRDRQVVPFDVASVQRVVLTHGTERLETVLQTDQWRFVPSLETEPIPANNAAVIAFFRNCATLKASAFLADAVTEPAALGLDKPDATVEFWTQPGRAPAEGQKKDPAGRILAATLVVSAPRDGSRACVVEPEPFVVAIPEKELAFLNVRPWDWRALDVWRVDEHAPGAFAVQGAAGSLRLARNGNFWKSESDAPIDQAAAESIFQMLGSLKAARWIGPEAKVDPKKPRARFRMEAGDGASLLLWREEERWIGLAQGAGAPEIFFELAPADGELLNQPLVRPPAAAPEQPKADSR